METSSSVSVLITNKCAERLAIRQHKIPYTHHESIPSRKITKLTFHQIKKKYREFMFLHAPSISAIYLYKKIIVVFDCVGVPVVSRVHLRVGE